MLAKLVAAAAAAVLLCSPVDARAACGDNVVDLFEDCDGGVCCTASCDFVSAGTVCRDRVATCGDGDDPCVCDAVETCTGSSASCPADGFEAAGTLCRAIAKDLFNCPNPNPISNCPDSACDVAEVCTGSAVDCPADAFEPSTKSCRSPQGVCDVEDFCPGDYAYCLPDTKSHAVCRPSAGSCDPAETCDGFHNDCAADTIAAVGTVCRSTAGVCDVAETCTGGPTCPADDFKSAATACRPSAGVCDVAESCTGSGAACPANDFEPAGTVCRPSIDAFCDASEACTGSGTQCPTDQFQANGTACDDGAMCTVQDVCTAGQCVGNSQTCGDGAVQGGCAEECDDGNTTSGDGCSSTCHAEAGIGCPFTPLTGCKLSVLPAKSSIQITDREKINGLKFIWRWRKGTAIDVADLGDPLTTTSYQLCVYDQGQLLTGATAPAAGTCGVTNPRPCWKKRGAKSFLYKDVWQSILPSGIKKLYLRAGRDGRSEVQLHATGGIFEFPSNGGLGLADLAAIQQPFRIQVQSSTGLCFETTSSAPPLQQTPNRFQDLAD